MEQLPERPGPATVREHLAELATRRRRAGDPSLEKLPDQPWEVLDYLAQHPAARLEDRAADVRTAFVLQAELRWQLIAHERRNLGIALDELPPDVRPTNSTVGAWLGGLHRQSVRDRLDRNTALLQRGRGHTEHDTREARTAAREYERQAAAEDAQLAEYAATLHTLRERLLHANAQLALDREGHDWLAEVERDHRVHDCSRQALTVLALAVDLIEDQAAGQSLEADGVCAEFRTLRATVRG